MIADSAAVTNATEINRRFSVRMTRLLSLS
jgi:hypothetical protein